MQGEFIASRGKQGTAMATQRAIVANLRQAHQGTAAARAITPPVAAAPSGSSGSRPPGPRVLSPELVVLERLQVAEARAQQAEAAREEMRARVLELEEAVHCLHDEIRTRSLSLSPGEAAKFQECKRRAAEAEARLRDADELATRFRAELRARDLRLRAADAAAAEANRRAADAEAQLLKLKVVGQETKLSLIADIRIQGQETKLGDRSDDTPRCTEQNSTSELYIYSAGVRTYVTNLVANNSLL